MEFGSKFVYAYQDNSDEEVVSDDELKEGLTKSSSSSDEEGAVAAQLPTKVAKEKSKKKSFALPSFFNRKSSKKNDEAIKTSEGSTDKIGKKVHHWQRSIGKDVPPPSPPTNGQKWRRADTNVIAVKFDHLTAPSNMHTGDAVVCKSCSAILSKLSKVEHRQDNKIWKCEFCLIENEVDIMEEEQPKDNDVTFMLEPALCTSASGLKATDQSIIVYCVDISGSMCLTSEVPGKIRFRGDHSTSLLSQYHESRHSQYLPHQRRDVTFVSRLQAVAAAIDHQLSEMIRNSPERRACLVTFNSEVQLLGDCVQTPVTVAGNKLSERDELITLGESFGLPTCVKESREKIGKKVFELEEGGQTALGPALLLSIAIAKRMRGSKVILCTDGMANIGLGNLDVDTDEAAYEVASNFFKEAGALAADAGVSVSVVTIKGTDCKLVELGQVADITGGHVNIVDPLKLQDEFGSVLEDAIIATKVTATLLLHKRLYFREEKSKESKIERFIGNVTRNTEITFEYGVRQNKKKCKNSHDKCFEPLIETIPETENLTAGNITQNVNNVSTDDSNDPSVPIEGVASASADASKITTPVKGSGVSDSAASPLATATADMSATDISGALASATFPMVTATACAAAHDSEENLSDLPFQLQIKYVDMDGAQALRVITQAMPITRQREDAENAMNTAVVAVHAAQRSANMAMQGAYEGSRLNNFMYKRLLRRRMQSDMRNDAEDDVYDAFTSNAVAMDLDLRNVSERSRSTVPRTLSMSSRTVPMPMLPSHSSYTDEEANRMYQNMKMNTKHLAKK